MRYRLPASIATLSAMLAIGVAPASAAPFVVSSTADSGAGTLRDAITQANATTALDTISFGGLATGDQVIALGSALPTVTQPLTIDGTTHPDYAAGAPGLTLDGGALASGDGLRLSGGGSTVKGLAISGFPGHGIAIDTAGGNVVQDNTIGPDNKGSGVAISSNTNTIGGIAAGQGNRITAAPTQDAVSVVSGTGNSIRGNTFTTAGVLAIDLGTDGQTANDTLDADAGANGRQNHPVLTAFSNSAGSATFTGTLNSTPDANYTLDFYVASGCGDGSAVWVGTAAVHTAPVTGNVAFNQAILTGEGGTFGLVTATDTAGNTSELSPAGDADAAAVSGLTTTCDPLAVAKAMAADAATVTAAAYVSVPPNGHPSAVGTGSFGGFPTNGSDYGVLSSGSAAHLAPAQSSGGGIAGGNQRGDTDFDVTVLRVDVTVPAAANCLTLDFRFLSDEYPTFVGSAYNDAFIAELDSSTWTTSGSTITATNNFAFDPSGDVISINSTGVTAMSQANAAGTGFDQNGATPLLHASKVVTAGAHSLYLSIFDQGDDILDSAVELDNLRFSTREAAACASGATDDVTPPVLTLATPADGSSSADATPTYSGTAGTLTGDLPTITVKIYAGTDTTGTLVDTVTATQSGGNWTIDGTTPLAPGTYTAQAQQSDTAGNTGFSTANTFTITSSTTLSVDNQTVTEGNAGTTNATFHVTLNQASADTVTVHYTTSNGTAVAPGDYTTTSGDLTFNPGDLSEDIVVPVVGDTLDENDETYSVTLSSPANASIADGSGTGTITDDDAAPTVSIADQAVSEGNSGTVNANLAVTLSAASGKTVTVQYATTDGSATAPADYTAVAGTTLTFNPGETSKNATVAVVGDTLDEVDETFTVGLSNPGSVTIGDGSGLGTIIDDDTTVAPVVPAISISGTTVDPEGDTGTKPATFTVSLSAATSAAVSVKFATADGTAGAPADYQSAAGTLSFAPGETSKTVTVNVAGDTLDEPNETFAVQLSDPVGGTLAAAQGTGTIVDDDPAPPVVKPPGSVDDDDVFCGRQHRGRCKGLQFTAQFQDAPGNASWTFDVFNPNPGGGNKAGTAAIKYVRVGSLKRAIKTTKPVKVTFKLTGAKADAAKRKIRKIRAKRLRITTTFKSAAGKTSKTVKVVRLR